MLVNMVLNVICVDHPNGDKVVKSPLPDEENSELEQRIIAKCQSEWPEYQWEAKQIGLIGLRQVIGRKS
jgi:hypothetical protein